LEKFENKTARGIGRADCTELESIGMEHTAQHLKGVNE